MQCTQKKPEYYKRKKQEGGSKPALLEQFNVNARTGAVVYSE